MQKRHLDRKIYFKEQTITTEKYIIPFITAKKIIDENSQILEIGCGEGGNLFPFVKLDCKKIIGIDLSKAKIESAKVFFKDYLEQNKINFMVEDIYKTRDLGKFDIILIKDVLEHIHNQQKFMNFIKKLLRPNGKIFISFPPWYNPFGGHQQMCKSKILSILPFFHILPASIYKAILRLFGESNAKIEGLLEIKETGITIERFEKILKNTGYKIDKKILYFINPNYEVKFGLKPRKLWSFVAVIPFIRNFFTTSGYYLVSIKDNV